MSNTYVTLAGNIKPGDVLMNAGVRYTVTDTAKYLMEDLIRVRVADTGAGILAFEFRPGSKVVLVETRVLATDIKPGMTVETSAGDTFKVFSVTLYEGRVDVFAVNSDYFRFEHTDTVRLVLG